MMRKALAAAVLGLFALAGLPTTAHADDRPSDWVATARAGAFDFGFVTTGGFIVDRIEPGGAIAETHIETATDQATGLAAAPYPSEIGQQGPGLLYGVLQNTLPYNGVPVPELPAAPSWPWTIRSSATGSDPPTAVMGDQSSPFRGKTESALRKASAAAGAGGSAPGTLSINRLEASSSLDATDPAKTVAKAASSIETLVVGDVLRFGEIHSTLEMIQAPGGKPAVDVKTSITGATIGGQAADFSQPLPAPLADALKAAGIEVSVGSVTPIDGGVVAKALTIRMPMDYTGMGADQLPFSAPHSMTVEFSFGVVKAQIAEVGALPDAGVRGFEGEPSPQPAAAPANAPGVDPPGERAAVPIAVPGSDPSLGRVVLAAADGTGLGGQEAKDEMGMFGWIAMGAAIVTVLLLVAGRARRVVG